MLKIITTLQIMKFEHSLLFFIDFESILMQSISLAHNEFNKENEKRINLLF